MHCQREEGQAETKRAGHPPSYAMANICRGIQYVHCMMHKCIMVKVGEGKTRKAC